MKMNAEQLVDLRASVTEFFHDYFAQKMAEEVADGNLPADMLEVCLETVMASEPVKASIEAVVARNQGAVH